MTRDAKFKRQVRDRMRATGENYISARIALRPQGKGPDVIEALGDPSTSKDAYARLRAMPEDAIRQAVLEGLHSDNWRIRRQCCRLLDHMRLTPETIAAMHVARQDPRPRVRAAAVHTLACEGCKPEACDFDAKALLLEVMRTDASAEVRRQAVSACWQFHDDADVAEACRERRDDDASARVRAIASNVVRSHDQEKLGQQRHRGLPAPVRAKVAKHAGKWVAVADGRIIAADRFPAPVRKAVRGNARPDAVVCWVPPADQTAQGANDGLSSRIGAQAT